MKDNSRPLFGGQPQEADKCRICGGDGRIDNTFGAVGRCPSCHGTGRRSNDEGFRDVTKTKASHHGPTNRVAVVEKATWPSTVAGAQLATQIRDASNLTPEVKARLTRDVIDHEATHGQCTQTFLKKVRKQIGANGPR